MHYMESGLEKPEPRQGVEAASLESKVGRTENVSRGSDVPPDIEYVPVDRINNPEIQGVADFRSPAEHASYCREAEMLKQMQPAIDQGAGPDTWDAWDRQHQIGHFTPNGYTRGYTDVYQGYYKQDTIAVEPRGDRYEILNGRHRVCAAREVNLKSVPARVLR